jgi:MFS family permease
MMPQILSYFCFGLGYIVYITFLVALMREQAAGPVLVSIIWVILGFGIMVSSFVWTPLFAKHSSGLPMALIMLTMSVGTCLAVLMPNTIGLILSSALFGLSVFMAPGAVTNFSRRNLPQSSWGAAVSLFTILFAVGQTIGPVAAGMLADALGNIGLSLLVAGATLFCGAIIASFQKPLVCDSKRATSLPSRTST